MCLWLCACRAEPTQTWLFIHADPSLAPAATMLRITIRPAGTEASTTRTDPVDRSGARIANLFLVPLNGDAARTFDVHAELMEGDSVRAELRVGGGYEDGKTRVIHAYFDASAFCAMNPDCGDGRTCQSGRCVGACFAGVPESEDSAQRELASCGECARCDGGLCDPLADGTACGCDGDECRDGVCVPAVQVREVASAEAHACAITSSGLFCWGDGRTGQVAQGAGGDVDRPTRVEQPEASNIVELALAAEYSCGRWIRSGPEFGHTCWGWSGGGAFGMGISERAIAEPIEAPDESSDDITAIDTGRFMTCVLRESGVIQCAGSNGSEQLGRPQSDFERADTWQDIEGPWDGLSAGPTTVCGLRNGEVYCWGGSTFDSSFSPTPTCIPDETGACVSNFQSVSVLEGRGCGLDRDGRAYCWGNNEGGFFGIDRERLDGATPVDTELRFASLVFGRGNSLFGITLDGALYAWGRNDQGQLGTGDQVSRLRPVRVEVDGGDRWLSVVAMDQYTCAIREDQQLYCWGRNGQPEGVGDSPVAGRLGLGLGADGNDPSTHVRVLRPERVCFE